MTVGFRAHHRVEDFLFQRGVDFQRIADSLGQCLLDARTLVAGVLVEGDHHVRMVEADHVGDGRAQFFERKHLLLQ